MQFLFNFAVYLLLQAYGHSGLEFESLRWDKLQIVQRGRCIERHTGTWGKPARHQEMPTGKQQGWSAGSSLPSSFPTHPPLIVFFPSLSLSLRGLHITSANLTLAR